MKLVTIITLLFLNICNTVVGQNIYSNDTYRFKIKFPDNWIIKSSSQPYTVIKAVRQSLQDISYITVAAYPIDNEDRILYEMATPEDIYENFISEYPANSSELIGSGFIEINGNRLIVTEIKVEIMNMTLLSQNYHGVWNGHLFRITGATNGGHDVYNSLKSTFKESIKSLSFF